MTPQLAFFLCGILAIAAVCAVFFVLAVRDATSRGRHTHAPAAAEPARPPEVHHEELPATGELAMLPPDPPPDDTVRLPHAVGTWGKTVTQILDELEAEYDRQQVTR